MSLVALLVTVVLVFLLVFFATFFLRLGASVAGVPKHKNTLGRALLILIVTWLVISALGGAGTFIPGLGNILGVLLAVLINVLIIGGIFDVSFGKAFVTYIFSLVFQVLFVLLGLFILGLLGASFAVLAA
ncbi:hypothetical protein H5P28_13750 [Ruficoccus amylovorans]|uniref:Uncharacterized protein n=1 Tax=Ruficoccus amylovorans TaxID=1804625 RepID=A0A842HII0_9BACT|nr:hypothetical protein [Ruficoccus amylovorans]MBC2595327.1 hypothetical protein [Ruficoccus amylovorans]